MQPCMFAGVFVLAAQALGRAWGIRREVPPGSTKHK